MVIKNPILTQGIYPKNFTGKIISSFLVNKQTNKPNNNNNKKPHTHKKKPNPPQKTSSTISTLHSKP